MAMTSLQPPVFLSTGTAAYVCPASNEIFNRVQFLAGIRNIPGSTPRPHASPFPPPLPRQTLCCCSLSPNLRPRQGSFLPLLSSPSGSSPARPTGDDRRRFLEPWTESRASWRATSACCRKSRWGPWPVPAPARRRIRRRVVQSRQIHLGPILRRPLR